MTLTPTMPTDKLPTLGDLLTTLNEADKAAQREHVARIAGDLNAAEYAAFVREGHMLDYQKFRRSMALWFLTAARYAAELYPGALTVYIDPAFRTEIDVTQEAVVEAEHRLDEVEDAVLALEERGGVKCH